jgi:hypothetical protein
MSARRTRRRCLGCHRNFAVRTESSSNSNFFVCSDCQKDLEENTVEAQHRYVPIPIEIPSVKEEYL